MGILKYLRNQRGSSLATTLIVISVLSVFVVGFQYAIYAYGVRTLTLHDESQAYLYARSAVLALGEELAEESAAEWAVIEALLEIEEARAAAAAADPEGYPDGYTVQVPDMTPKHPVLLLMSEELEDYGDSITFDNAAFQGANYNGNTEDTGTLSMTITYQDVNAYVISATSTVGNCDESVSFLLYTNDSVSIPDDVQPPAVEEEEEEDDEAYSIKLASMVGFTAPTMPMMYTLDLTSATRFFSYLPIYLYDVGRYSASNTTIYCPYSIFITGNFAISNSSNLVSGDSIILKSGTTGDPIATNSSIFVKDSIKILGGSIDSSALYKFSSFPSTYTVTQPVWVSAVRNVSTYTNAATASSWNTSPNGENLTVYAWDGGWNGSTLTVSADMNVSASNPVYFVIQEGQSIKITGSTGLGCHFYIEEGGELIFTQGTTSGYIYAEPVMGTQKTDLYSALQAKIDANGDSGTMQSIISAYQSDIARVQLADSGTFTGSISGWFQTNYYTTSSKSSLYTKLVYAAPLDSNYTAFYTTYGNNGTTVTVTDSSADIGTADGSTPGATTTTPSTGRESDYLVYNLQQFIKE
ncbi:hypothetical protein RFF05_16275 [Bengtsoniella intestinalis]|uniref:hypothetical protein n=1 Tax=Bengtsoniella intestinalis TaxID=3073143 RepID=UPI00391F7949